MGAWSLAAVAGIVLAYIALQTWRPGVVPPAIAFTAAGLVSGPRAWAGQPSRLSRRPD